MTFGRMLPTNNNYNFSGILDEIRIYNYALPVSEIDKLAGLTTAVKDAQNASVPKRDLLLQNYPNPFNPSTTISWQLAKSSRVSLKIYDILGNEVTTLVNEFQIAGSHSISFNAEQAGTRKQLASGIYFSELKIDSETFYKKMVYLK
jgi:predicted secreted protein